MSIGIRASRLLALAAAGLVLGLSASAWAAAPEPWQTGFQPAVTPSMEATDGLHTFLLWIIAAISAFVLALLLYVIVRFNAKANPVPSRTTHNTLIEIVWTVIPIIILVVIAVPSFKQLYFIDRVQEADMTLKAIGHQWYWTYEYPDHEGLEFDAVIKAEEDLAPGEPRLLATDNRVMVPVDTTVRLLVTATDVLHSWAMPAFGIKLDAVPGRVNETWFRVEREGVYYGQCSELCGVNHGFMPIMVEAVSKERFAAWLSKAKKEFAGGSGDNAGRVIARATPEPSSQGR